MKLNERVTDLVIYIVETIESYTLIQKYTSFLIYQFKSLCCFIVNRIVQLAGVR